MAGRCRPRILALGGGGTDWASVTVEVQAPSAMVNVRAGLPERMDVGRIYRIPVTVSGISARGLDAAVQRPTRRGWVKVAERTLTRSGSRIPLKATTSLAGLRPDRVRRTITMRARLVVPDDQLVASAGQKVRVRARVNITVSGPLDRSHVPSSYRPGCPTGPPSRRRMTVHYWDYAGQRRRGRLIVRSDTVGDLTYVFTKAFNQGFQVKKMRPADRYYRQGRRSPTHSDRAAMRAGNTSAFNCRPVLGNPPNPRHTPGVAIDINTFENPYVVWGGSTPRVRGRVCSAPPAAWA